MSLLPVAVAGIVEEACRASRTTIDDIKAAAEFLAETMQRVHGGDWRVTINHRVEFITVARRRSS